MRTPLQRYELRALRRLKRKQAPSRFVFTSERGDPLTRDGFAAIVRRTAAKTGIEVKVHTHMLRHGCGYHLVNQSVNARVLQEYMCHKNYANTVR